LPGLFGPFEYLSPFGVLPSTVFEFWALEIFPCLSPSRMRRKLLVGTGVGFYSYVSISLDFFVNPPVLVSPSPPVFQDGCLILESEIFHLVALSIDSLDALSLGGAWLPAGGTLPRSIRLSPRTGGVFLLTTPPLVWFPSLLFPILVF